MTDTSQDQAAASAEAPPKVDFRVTTYWKRGRNEPGLTSMASKRLALGLALDLILGELPDDAILIDGNDNSVTIVIDWTQVPDEIRYGTCGTKGYR